MTRFAPLLVASCALLACDPSAGDSSSDGGGDGPATDDTGGADDGADDDGATGDTAADDTGGSADAESGEDDADDTGETTAGTEPGVWSELAGPCGGSATNAMWFDDPMVGFAGCGENAEGEGLFTTVDGGATWEDHPQFNEVRVMDIRRGPDGVLRGAGIHQLDGYSVFEIDEEGSLSPSGLYQPGNSAFSSVTQAENVAVTEDGQIMIDSLTGTSAAHQASGAKFEEIESLSEEAIADPDGAHAFQVKRIVGHDNAFYAVGSLINDPARVHLPSMLAGATYHFTTLELQPSTRDGELQDMYMWSADRMIVAGFDQSERYPLIYVADGDPYDAANWTQSVLLDSGIEFEGGINDLHVVGETVIAIGEKFPTSQGGFVIISEDGGLTWEDISPEDPGALSAGWLFEDGTIIAAGGGGELWTLQ